MPHLVLEYSDNVVDTVDHVALFAELHTALLDFESFPLADIKSRITRCQQYCIGDNNAVNAFVHLNLALLSGRDISVRQRIVQACQKVLVKHFAQSLTQLQCQISTEVRDIDRSTYAKHKSSDDK